ncbi:MAG: hypothetical protein ACLQVY_20980, partial [Limisphaerales bacterium]
MHLFRLIALHKEPEKMHELMAATLEKAIEEIRRIKENALNKKDTTRPRWPM